MHTTFSLYFRVKKKFDEPVGPTAQTIAPNLKSSLNAAIAAAAAPALEVAQNLHASSIPSTTGSAALLPSTKEQVEKTTHDQVENANEMESTIRRMSSKMAPPIGLGLAGDPCIDEGEDEELDQEFIPYFQRVSVSGDDTTGVSIFLVLILLNI